MDMPPHAVLEGNVVWNARRAPCGRARAGGSEAHFESQTHRFGGMARVVAWKSNRQAAMLRVHADATCHMDVLACHLAEQALGNKGCNRQMLPLGSVHVWDLRVLLHQRVTGPSSLPQARIGRLRLDVLVLLA